MKPHFGWGFTHFKLLLPPDYLARLGPFFRRERVEPRGRISSGWSLALGLLDRHRGGHAWMNRAEVGEGSRLKKEVGEGLTLVKWTAAPNSCWL